VDVAEAQHRRDRPQHGTLLPRRDRHRCHAVHQVCKLLAVVHVDDGVVVAFSQRCLGLQRRGAAAALVQVSKVFRARALGAQAHRQSVAADAQRGPSLRARAQELVKDVVVSLAGRL
jgi:hypothetical protein